ncbi:hypothetical protein GOARA_028_00190 [Gordonia araii NBRC 100433]|uniref:Uncharacterized protein n=1 Tax=Gordonia araii NBRC 100433 TaxID=1073574 RepID=G7GZT3_9ACTN|nr:hypothetical protein [Gordonia araii]GAB09108.1 hypothetical protein GOARA_028_00190 [Gordonia araii NBRC 100433]
MRAPAYVSREKRFSLGIDDDGRRYISIPIAGRMVDYEEFYGLDAETYERLLADPDRAFEVAEQCRDRMHDRLLLHPPAPDRGAADVLGDPVPICYDQVDLAGRRALVLVDHPTNDAGWPVDLPAGTTHVIIVDDTPNPTMTLRVHPIGKPDDVVYIDHSQLGFTGR